MTYKTDIVVLGLHGLPGAGKDTVADYLVVNQGFVKMAFADILKDELTAHFRVSREVFNNKLMKVTPLHVCSLAGCTQADFVTWYESTTEGQAEIAEYADFNEDKSHLAKRRTPRWLMQRWGDWRRSQLLTYFIDKLEEKIILAISGGQTKIIVTDVRFDNEARLVKAFAQNEIWWVRRLQAEINKDKHSSNKRLSPSMLYRIIQNYDSMSNLHYQINEAITEIKNKWPNVLT